MATITGLDKIKEYLTKNPNAQKAKILSGASQIAQILPKEVAQPQSKKKNVLQSIIESVTDPFVGLGKMGLETGHRLLNKGQKSGKYIDDKDYNIGNFIKNLAGASSFFIPAGVGVKGAMALGTASGALSGLSEKEGNTAENIVKGGLLGGVTGGVFNKLFGKAGKGAIKGLEEGVEQTGEKALVKAGAEGTEAVAEKPGIFKKLFNKANETGKNIERGMTGIKPEKVATGIQKAEGAADDFIKITTNRGFKPTGEGMGQAYKAISKELGEKLPSAANMIDNTNIIDNLSEVATREGVDLASKGNDNLINSLLQKTSEAQGNPKEIAKLISEIDGDLGTAYKVAKSGTRALSDSEKLRMAFRESLSQNLKNSIPEVAPLYKELSVLNEVAPDVIKAAEKSSQATIPFTNMKIPLGGVDTKIKGAAAKVLQGGAPGSGAIQGVASQAQKIGAIPGLKQAARGAVVNSALSSSDTPPTTLSPLQQQLVTQLLGREPTQEDIDQLAKTGLVPLAQQFEAEQSMQPDPRQEELMKQMEAEKQKFIIDSIQNGQSPEEAMATAETIFSGTGGVSGGAGGKILPAGQVEKLSATQASLQGLDDLEQMADEMSNRLGPVQGGALGDLVNSIGLDPERAGFKTRINTLAQNLGKALEGGKLTDSDIARYRGMLPTLKDPPAIFKQKLQAVKVLVQQQMDVQSQGFQQAGYNSAGVAPGLSEADLEL